MRVLVASDAQKSLDALWHAYRASPFVAQNYDLVPTSVVQALLNARYYDSARGQFTSQDPVFWNVKQNLLDPQSLNAYSYAEDNPVTKKDPTGLAASLPASFWQSVVNCLQSYVSCLTSGGGGGGNVVTYKATNSDSTAPAVAKPQPPLGDTTAGIGARRAQGPLTLRLAPLAGAIAQLELYDDDGESLADRTNPPCRLLIEVEWLSHSAAPRVRIARTGAFQPRWSEFRFEDAAGRAIPITRP